MNYSALPPMKSPIGSHVFVVGAAKALGAAAERLLHPSVLPTSLVTASRRVCMVSAAFRHAFVCKGVLEGVDPMRRCCAKAVLPILLHWEVRAPLA